MTHMARLAAFTAAIALAALAAGDAAPAYGASFTVNAMHDAVDAAPGDGVCADAGGACTLRAAVMETNALPGADEISLSAGTYTLTIPGQDEDFAMAGDLDIRDNLTIAGAGESSTVVEACHAGGASCLGIDRVLHIGAAYTDAHVGLSDLTMQNGRAEPVIFGGSGGGIFNDGVTTLDEVTLKDNLAGRGGGIYNDVAASLTITNSTISDNAAPVNFSSRGGGIANDGALTIRDSTVSANFAAFWGGGILSNGTLTLEDSVVSDNETSTGTGSFAGGINAGGDTTIMRSTISGNVGEFGAGIYTTDRVTVSHSLISANEGTGFVAGFGGSATAALINVTISGNSGGIDNFSDNDLSIASSTITDAEGSLSNEGTVTLLNTILNGSGGNCFGDAPISLGHNLDSDGSCGLTGPGDRSNIGPMLAPLANNGGPTETQALLAGSPAIDAGDAAACPVTDQRGFIRPADGNNDGSAVCDIGAFEFGAVAPVTASPTASPSPAQPIALPPTGGRAGGAVPIAVMLIAALPVIAGVAGVVAFGRRAR